MKRRVLVTLLTVILVTLLVPVGGVAALTDPWVFTNTAYALYHNGDVTLWVDVWCNPNDTVPTTMLAQYREVGAPDWTPITPLRELTDTWKTAKFWWSKTVSPGVNYQVRGAAYHGAAWYYGSIITLETPGVTIPYVSTGYGWWTGETTARVEVYGSPGDETYAYLYAQYREIGEVDWLTTPEEYITEWSQRTFELSGLSIFTGAEYRAVLECAEVTYFGEIREVHTESGQGLECEYQPSGTGTVGDPYIITDICELSWVRNSLAAYYELGNDIDASTTRYWNWNGSYYEGWEPVGTSGVGSRFEGNFDGKGHSITNLYIYRPATSHVGLFAWISGSGYVANVRITNADITAYRYVGVLAGQIRLSGDVVRVDVSGSVTAIGDGLNSQVGGLAGSIAESGSTIHQCSSTASVTGTNGAYTGGLIGGLSEASVTQSFATGSVNGGWFQTGGFVGFGDKGSISDCYARGSVIGASRVGGFVGETAGISTITRVYSTGAVSGSGSDIGGLRGKGTSSLTNSFWDTQTSGQGTSAGGTGKTTAQMKTKSTFTAAGWDFVTIWDIHPAINDGYPYFGWAYCILQVETYYPEVVRALSFDARGGLTQADPSAVRRGFAYFAGTTGTPTLSDSVVQQTGTFGVGAFTLPIVGLEPQTAYRVRAFAESECFGVAWGETITVVTLSEPVVVTVRDEVIAEHLPTWRRLFGYVEYDGGVYIEVRFQYGTSNITFSHATSWQDKFKKTCPQRGFQTGDEFFADISGLARCTTYYYRAQVWSEDAGIGSGEILMFTTSCEYEEDALTVFTYDETNYTGTSFQANGAIVYANPNAFRRGFVYMVGGVGHPTEANSIVQQGGDFGAGSFSMLISGLNAASQYRVRAFAQSSVGIVYGNTITVPKGSEPTGVPVMATHSATDIGDTSFRARGEIVSTATPVTERGFVYLQGSTGTPTAADSVEDEFGNWGAVTYQLGITGLATGTPYRVRAYGINSAGIGYGDTITVTTVGDASVITNPATNIATTAARLNGQLVSDGGDHCQVRFEWGYATGVYTYATLWTNGMPSGTFFHADIIALSGNTTYYFRAQARNSAGTVSGDELSFTTGDELQPPWPFSAQGISGTEINITWTKGSGAQNTIIQMAMGNYPADINSGLRVYFNAGTHVIVPGLIPGMTYYFRAWSESGGDVSANYSQDLATTLAGDPWDPDPPPWWDPDWDWPPGPEPPDDWPDGWPWPPDPDQPSLPGTPWGWFKAPSTDRIQNAFFYPWVNSVFDSFQMPYTTGWMGLALLLVALAGVGSLSISHNIWIALVVTGFGIFIAGILCVIPLWPLIIVLLAGGGYAYIKSRP